MPTTTPKTFFNNGYAVVGPVDADNLKYTAVNCKAIIDKYTGSNISAGNVNVDVYLVASGGTPTDANRIIKSRQIAPNETYTFPELVGKQLDAGGMIYEVCNTASALVTGANGREITA